MHAFRRCTILVRAFARVVLAGSVARDYIDYQVEVDGHDYSVPYTLVKQTLEVRLTDCTVECEAARA